MDNQNALGLMTSKLFTNEDFVKFYANTWRRNCIAATIDVLDDERTAAENPNKLVIYEHPETNQLLEMPVTKRIEYRKIYLAKALHILDTIIAITGKTDADFNAEWENIRNAVKTPQNDAKAEVAPTEPADAPATPESKPEAKTEPVQGEGEQKVEAPAPTATPAVETPQA